MSAYSRTFSARTPSTGPISRWNASRPIDSSRTCDFIQIHNTYFDLSFSPDALCIADNCCYCSQPLSESIPEQCRLNDLNHSSIHFITISYPSTSFNSGSRLIKLVNRDLGLPSPCQCPQCNQLLGGHLSPIPVHQKSRRPEHLPQVEWCSAMVYSYHGSGEVIDDRLYLSSNSHNTTYCQSVADINRYPTVMRYRPRQCDGAHLVFFHAANSA